MFTERSTTISAALEADWQPEVTYRQTDIAISARSGGASSYRWHWTAFRDWDRASSSSGRECSPVKTLNSKKERNNKVSERSTSHSTILCHLLSPIAIQLSIHFLKKAIESRWKMKEHIGKQKVLVFQTNKAIVQ